MIKAFVEVLTAFVFIAFAVALVVGGILWLGQQPKEVSGALAIGAIILGMLGNMYFDLKDKGIL